MSTEDLYQNTIELLNDLLQDTVNSFSRAYDTIYNYYDSKPLFSITSRDLELVKHVDHFSKHQTRNVLAQLCQQISAEFGYEVTECTDASDVDFFLIIGDNKIGFYVSMVEMYMPNIETAVISGMNEHYVIVPNCSLANLCPNFSEYHNYPYKDITHRITLENFFDYIHPREFAKFQEYIERFNYDAEMMLGLTVAPIPTQKALQKKRNKVISEFESLFFEDVLPCSILEYLDVLRERFHNSGILQMTSAPFIDSFVSSEWYYDLRASTDGEMEQTAIVAGYLKAIEQLLFSLMLSRCDTLKFKLKTKSNSFDVLTKNNKSNLLTMANNLLKSIEKNYGTSLHEVYVNKIIGFNTQSFLSDFFRQTRNGYFHKDNIYSFEKIKEIRKKAYCAFFLLGSSFIFDIEDLKSDLYE